MRINYIASMLLAAALLTTASAQNYGINQPAPQERLHVSGNIRTDNALILQPHTALTPAATIALPNDVSTVRIGFAAGTTANVLTPPSSPKEGQVLYIANNDDNAATFVGTSIAPTNGFNHYLYLGGAWRLISASPAATGWELGGNTGTAPGTAAGQNFLGTTDGQDFVIATQANERLRVFGSGALRMTGDLINQELTGTVLTYGQTIAAPTPPQYGCDFGHPHGCSGHCRTLQ